MGLKNDSKRYGAVAKTFHWVMGLGIIGMLAMGLYMADLPFSPFKMEIYGLHKSIGAVILVLAVLRAVWWLGEVKPKMVKTLPAWSHPYVSFGHHILYAFMVLMPLSGWILTNAAGYPVSVFGLFELPTLVGKDAALRGVFGEVHEVTATVLIVLLVAHIGAALVHHFWFRDDTLRKMLPGGK